MKRILSEQYTAFPACANTSGGGTGTTQVDDESGTQRDVDIAAGGKFCKGSNVVTAGS